MTSYTEIIAMCQRRTALYRPGQAAAFLEIQVPPCVCVCVRQIESEREEERWKERETER